MVLFIVESVKFMEYNPNGRCPRRIYNLEVEHCYVTILYINLWVSFELI